MPQATHSKTQTLAALDPVWSQIRDEAEEICASEPALAPALHSDILRFDTLEASISSILAQKLSAVGFDAVILAEELRDAFSSGERIGQKIRADIVAFYERDPACHRFIEPFWFFKGFQAIEAQRAAHVMWKAGRKDLAMMIQKRISEIYAVDIHPAAEIGQGIMVDHAHGLVIGETAVVGDNVSLLHAVTLGGTGKEEGDRHPKIGNGVLIGAGAKVLGNIRIGNCSRIAAGSVVLSDVPACKTVAGVPAKVVGEAGCAQPALSMNQQIDGC